MVLKLGFVLNVIGIIALTLTMNVYIILVTLLKPIDSGYDYDCSECRSGACTNCRKGYRLSGSACYCKILFN